VRTHLLCVVAAVLISCGEETPADDAGFVPEGGVCSPLTCPGCCVGSVCRVGTENGACGAAGLPCVVCQQPEFCAQGQCIQSTGTCNPSNCPDGCCDGDACLPGTAKEACGTGGIPCISCAASQQCESQSCGCGPGSCNGCCENGVCRSGTDPTACGSGGAACTKCNPGDSCVLGSCSGSDDCNAQVCSGCCAGSVCQTGTSDTACGAGGQTCEACQSGESCQQGTCVNSAQCGPSSCPGCCSGSQCLSGTSDSACGSGGAPCKPCSSVQICSSGACTLDPSSSWGVIIVSAEIDSSQSWDSMVYTEPDPYVVVTVGSQSDKTTTQDDTYSPQWDEYLFDATASEILGSGLGVEIYDDDWPTSDQLIGNCQIAVPDSVLLAGAGYVSSCGSQGHVQSFSFKLTPN
jgi:hypothetical protein